MYTQMHAGLDALSQMMSPAALLASTKLLTEGGSHIREGSTLFITTLPKGNVVLHGKEYVCVCVCVHMRGHEREREGSVLLFTNHILPQIAVILHVGACLCVCV